MAVATLGGAPVAVAVAVAEVVLLLLLLLLLQRRGPKSRPAPSARAGGAGAGEQLGPGVQQLPLELLDVHDAGGGAPTHAAVEEGLGRGGRRRESWEEGSFHHRKAAGRARGERGQVNRPQQTPATA